MNHDEGNTTMDRIATSPTEYARNGDLDSDKLAGGRGVLLGLAAGSVIWGVILMAFGVI